MSTMLVNRIRADEAHAHVESGDALLVCGYDDPKKFEKNHLAGALSLSEFEARAGEIPKDQEIIFYCA